MLKLIAILFSFFGVIAPRLTGRAAFRLFCTTAKVSKSSLNYQRALAAAEPLFAKATHHRMTYSGGTVAVHKTTYILHGWQSSSMMMYKFIEPVLAQGHRVVCVDLPGHGESSGRVFHIPLAVDAMQRICAELGPYDYVITHSLGGMVASSLVAGTVPTYPPIVAEKLVLISSSNSVSRLFDDYCRMVKLRPASVAEFYRRVRPLADCDVEDFVVSKQLSETEDELLVIHAVDDKEVPFSEAEEIAACKPNASLHRADGLGHRRIIASDDVVNAAVNFILRVEK